MRMTMAALVTIMNVQVLRGHSRDPGRVTDGAKAWSRSQTQVSRNVRLPATPLLVLSRMARLFLSIIGCIIHLSQGSKNVLLGCDCGREIYIWYCSWEPSHEGGDTKVQTRIGSSLIKRGCRFAWLALIDSAKILTITGARSWLFPTKSYRVKRLLLHFTFYRTDAVLYRSTLPCFFTNCRLYRVSSGPKGFSTSLPKCLYKMSHINVSP